MKALGGSSSRSGQRSGAALPLRASLPCAVILVVAGCQSMTPGPVPIGPGAATETPVDAWMAEAEIVDYVGTIENILVASQQGAYATWSLAPAGPHVGCEIDIRPCAADAERLRGQRVRVHGRLIEREYPHLPLVVAEQIIPHDGGGISPSSPHPTAPPPPPRTIARRDLTPAS